MNAPPEFFIGHLDDGTPVLVRERMLEPGVAFDPSHVRFTRPYTQINAPGFPDRPGGLRTFAAHEHAALFRCETRALEAVRAAEVDSYLIGRLDGHRVLVPLGELIDWMIEEAKTALLEEIKTDEDLAERLVDGVKTILREEGGLVTQTDIDAREARRREVARLGGRDLIEVVK
jgi:hypothetical protein